MRRLTFFALHKNGIACRMRTIAKKTTKISELKIMPTSLDAALEYRNHAANAFKLRCLISTYSVSVRSRTSETDQHLQISRFATVKHCLCFPVYGRDAHEYGLDACVVARYYCISAMDSARFWPHMRK